MTDRKDAATAVEEEAQKLAGSDAETLETKTDGKVYTHVFSEPVTFEGETYTELTFDFGKLRGKDVLAVTREMRMEGHAILVKNLDDDYIVRMAARACTKPLFHGIFGEMSVPDFNRITSVARRFF